MVIMLGVTHYAHGVPDWGSVAEWVAALAAILAFVAAVIAIFYSAKAARLSTDANRITAAAYDHDVKERNEAQARFVYALTDPIRTLEVGENILYGESQRLAYAEPGAMDTIRETAHGVTRMSAIARVHFANVNVHNRSAEIVGPISLRLYDLATGLLYADAEFWSDAPILPEQREDFAIAVQARTDEPPQLRTQLVFRDSSGRWWQRRDYEPIESLAVDPRKSA